MTRSLARPRWSCAVCAACLLLAGVVAGPFSLGAESKPNAPTAAAPNNAAELRLLEGRIKQVVAKVLPSVVGVRVGSSQGSGVLVSADGYVLTAGHVVGKPGQDVTFIFHDGKTAKGKTLGMFKSADAGLMKITDKGKWPFVEKGAGAAIQPGTWCVAVGHPFGYREGRPPVVRVGRILRAKETVLQTDCPLIAGDSGGPLFDLAGRVIGINSRIGGSTSMNYHVPIKIFLDNWERLAKGEEWQLELPGRDDVKVKAAFRSLVADVSKCVVRVKCDGKDAALGTIVGPNGWVVTKASELKGKIGCTMRDGKELEAKLVGVSPHFDLAMLKLNVTGLPIIHWGRATDPAVGQWVAAVGPREDPLAIGVISVPRRKIPPPSGVLGIVIEDGKQGPFIRQIIPKSPAEKAGLKPKDTITHCNGKSVKNRIELVKIVKQHRPGQAVKLNVLRGKQKLELNVTLAVLNTPSSKKRHLQNRTGVGLSKRHNDFPIVLQHDTVLKPVDCGGPLVDLGGKAIGINVARGGRTETYTVPVDVLMVLMYDMMSGRLPPPKTEAEKKAEAAKIAAEKAAKEKAAAEKVAAEKAAKEKAAKEAAEKKAAAEKAAKEKAAREKAAKEKVEADKKAAMEKKAAGEKVAREKAEAEKKAREKVEADKKAAEQKAAAEKAAKKKAEADKKPAPKK